MFERDKFVLCAFLLCIVLELPEPSLSGLEPRTVSWALPLLFHVTCPSKQSTLVLGAVFLSRLVPSYRDCCRRTSNPGHFAEFWPLKMSFRFLGISVPSFMQICLSVLLLEVNTQFQFYMYDEHNSTLNVLYMRRNCVIMQADKTLQKYVQTWGKRSAGSGLRTRRCDVNAVWCPVLRCGRSCNVSVCLSVSLSHTFHFISSGIS
jgi:hypothetical protein